MPENSQNPEVPEVEDPDLSAQIAAEEPEVAEPVLPPSGAPTLIPVGALTRRQRADFFNKQRSMNFASAKAAKEAADEAEESGADQGQDEGTTVKVTSMAVAADSFEAMAAMEEALRVVVMPGAQKAYDRWVREASDADLSQLYRSYMANFKPGEAQPSPTS